jgi:hypothetical protein
MTRLAALALAVGLAGCAGGPTPSDVSTAAIERPPTFVNRVWKVGASASVPPGMLYVFLEDGTLVMAGPGGKPAFGSWRRDNGTLVMIEESIPYKVDILELTNDTFRIRSHNPGEPVEITLLPAK